MKWERTGDEGKTLTTWQALLESLGRIEAHLTRLREERDRQNRQIVELLEEIAGRRR